MAILMASLNPTKTGEFVARKVIPKDARKEYKRLYGVSTEAILKVPAGTPKAQAKALHGQWLAEVETRIERIRAVARTTTHASQRLRLGAARLTGAQGRYIPWQLFGALVPKGLTGGLGNGRSALYATCRRVCDLVAIRGKADVARTSRFCSE
jgi:hypothetical protein